MSGVLLIPERFFLVLMVSIISAGAFAADEKTQLEEFNRRHRIRIRQDGSDLSDSASHPTRAPSSLPSPIPSPVPTPEFHFSNLTFVGGLNYADLSSTDRTRGGNAYFLSDLNLATRVIWHQVWSRNWRTFGSFQLKKVSYSQVPPGIVLNGGSSIYSGFQMGVERKLHPRFALALTLGAREETFVIAESLKAFRMERVAVPEFGVATRWIFIPPQPLGLSLESKAELLLPRKAENFQTEMGRDLTFKLKIEQQHPQDRVGLGLFYSLKTYGANIESVSEHEIGLEFDIRFTIGH